MLEFVILMTGNHSSCRITKEMFHDSLSRNPIFHNGSEKCQKFKGVLVKMFLPKIKRNYTITGKTNSIMRLLSYIDMVEKISK